MRLVQTKNRRAAIAVLNKLKRGATWSSLGATKETFDTADETAVGRAVFRAKLNRTTRYGRVVFRVIRHIPERPMPRAQQEALAWEKLASEAQQRALDAFTADYTAKWRQRTACAPAYARIRTAANRQGARSALTQVQCEKLVHTPNFPGALPTSGKAPMVDFDNLLPGARSARPRRTRSNLTYAVATDGPPPRDDRGRA